MAGNHIDAAPRTEAQTWTADLVLKAATNHSFSSTTKPAE